MASIVSGLRLLSLGVILVVASLLLSTCGGDGSTMTETDFLAALTGQNLAYSNIRDGVYGPLSAPEANSRLQALEKEMRAARAPTERTRAIADELLALVTTTAQATEKLAAGEWSMLDYQAFVETLSEREAAVLTSIKKLYFDLGTPLLNRTEPHILLWS
jgi:hypothetical protein